MYEEMYEEMYKVAKFEAMKDLIAGGAGKARELGGRASQLAIEGAGKARELGGRASQLAIEGAGKVKNSKAGRFIERGAKAQNIRDGIEELKLFGLKEKEAWKDLAKGVGETGLVYGAPIGLGAYGANKLLKKRKDEEKAAYEMYEEMYKVAKFEAMKDLIAGGAGKARELGGRASQLAIEGAGKVKNSKAGRFIERGAKAKNIRDGIEELKLFGLKEKEAWKDLAKGVGETGAVYGAPIGLGAYGASKLLKKRENEEKAAYYYAEEMYKEAKFEAIKNFVTKNVEKAVNSRAGQFAGRGAKATNLREGVKRLKNSKSEIEAGAKNWGMTDARKNVFAKDVRKESLKQIAKGLGETGAVYGAPVGLGGYGVYKALNRKKEEN